MEIYLAAIFISIRGFSREEMNGIIKSNIRSNNLISFFNKVGIGMKLEQYNKIIMHVDVNSAYLSWQAVYELQKGSDIDIRKIPAVVGGSQEERRGIVLAKSIPAKKMGIKTGEVLWKARQKCPHLLTVPTNYELYMKCSNALYKILQEYSTKVQRFSIDEFFLDYTGMEIHYGKPVDAAHCIKDRIKRELGFTVNIGIGTNKLTAKIAGDLEKPDRVHTLFPNEIESKMWLLPVEDLFMVGPKTRRKLKDLNIYTIGDLAKTELRLLESKLKSFGRLIWCYANGIEKSPVQGSNYLPMKAIGNSTTIKFDVEDRNTAYKVLLSLTESVALRLRAAHSCCRVVTVSIRTSELNGYSHQRKLFSPTNITNEIYEVAKKLFDECWKGEKIRHLGVRVSELCSDEFMQITFFDEKNREKKRALDYSIDAIREKYGKYSIIRGTFADGEVPPMAGGVGEEGYPFMSSIL